MTSGAKAQTGAKTNTSVTLSGDVTGPSSANTVAKINGSPLGTTTGATTGYVLTWNGSAWAPAAVGGSGVTSFNTRTGAVVPANADYLAVATGGLTGATGATRFVGGTANGAPTSGSFQVGDFIVDETASIWICVVAGTPGTWATSISNHVTLRSATATAKYNEITLFTGSTAGQTISAVGSPIDSVTWSVINNSSVPLTLSFSANAMYPLGSSSTVTSYTVGVASAYSFVNYNGGNWYMTGTNDLSNGTGIVAVTNGGTGTSTAPAVGSIPLGTSTSAYTPLSIGTNGQVLTSNGTTATWATASAGAPGTTVSSFITTQVDNLTTNSYKNITSISLTAGTWLINYQSFVYNQASGENDVCLFIGTTSASTTGLIASCVTVLGTPQANYSYAQTLNGTYSLTLASTTTIYLNGYNTKSLTYYNNASAILSSSMNNTTGIVAVRTA